MRTEIKRHLTDKNKHLARVNDYKCCHMRQLKQACDCCLLACILQDEALAKQLLTEHQGLKPLFDRLLNQTAGSAIDSQQDLATAKLQSAILLYQRYLHQELADSGQLLSPDATRAYLRATLFAKQAEVFAVLFLDNAHRIIEYEELFTGTINGANVYPRVVLQKALNYNAAALILAHNHPSGVAEPSEADKAITKSLVKLLDQVDIRVLDHIVIGANQMVSFAERGMI